MGAAALWDARGMGVGGRPALGSLKYLASNPKSVVAILCSPKSENNRRSAITSDFRAFSGKGPRGLFGDQPEYHLILAMIRSAAAFPAGTVSRARLARIARAGSEGPTRAIMTSSRAKASLAFNSVR